MFTSSRLSEAAFLLIQRPNEATLFLMKVSMPGQKNLCLISDTVLSLPWCPRSSCRAVKIFSRKAGRRTSCRKSCPFSTTLWCRTPLERSILSHSLRYLPSNAGSRFRFSGACNPASRQLTIKFKVGSDSWAFLQSIFVRPWDWRSCSEMHSVKGGVGSEASET